MELRNMQNTTQIHEQVEQLRLASLELAHGCGLAIEIGVTVEDIGLLVVALEEMHGHAKKLLASMTIDPALDHDGDTQPSNDKPTDPPAPAPWCEEDDASCDCLWHENYRRALATGGGVTQ
jgi:hypothetical protein